MTLIDVALVGGGGLHRGWLRLALDQSQFAVMAEGRDFSSVLDLMNKGGSPRLVIADISRLSDKVSRIFAVYETRHPSVRSLCYRVIWISTTLGASSEQALTDTL
jgi:hypothetical protein